MRTTVAELFRKQLPPRLAKVTDLTDEWEVYRVRGATASARHICKVAQQPRQF
jgi:hypothetical protein